MATLKATVKSKRKDGMYVVYIRFAHNRKVSYLRTSWMVNDKGLSRNKKDIGLTHKTGRSRKLWTIFRKVRMEYRSQCTLVSILRR